ncbi:phosphatase PAP2 family protein [Paenisporosarcina sp. TG20]|uniref:phosphatase PAP2 family protein n=1 Tax=Paenisporosarcina sp. TG20 TaxID=1211706 RepID=UPI0002D4F717|nr:phosphatase PAP2 family protein [Paenisporosarcina sp. TG20]
MDEQQKLKKVGFPFVLLLIGLGIATLFSYTFLEIAEGLMENEIETFDSAIISTLKIIESGIVDQFFVFITELGSVWFLTSMSILLILTLWLTKKDKWGIIFFILAIGGGGILTQIFKHYFGRERPSINPEIDAIGYSFPSGHSMGSLIFYGFVIYFVARTKLSRKMKWIFAILAGILVLLIGISRIYLGAHFPSDVVSGYMAGGVWMIACIISVEWMIWRSRSDIRPLDFFRKFLGDTINRTK